ncbi:hypothetical protein J2M53_14340 [Arthrobacter sp. zg-ZUI100]|uniref:hypothetical protein n=1 Tax=Arthrobacter jiangjiafuii TaxID=2817475 RepID=UPI001AEF01F1|nr:hypothetical protein [Arthrobacter jiangjiafuii]MBP3037425.1 hypothetical protein [Arthrobacter jiangjiafuii]
MAINRSPGTRADFPFLTRRVKPATASAAAAPSVHSAVQSAAPAPAVAAPPATSTPPSSPPSLSLGLSRPTTPRLGTQPPPPAATTSSSVPSLSLGLSPAAEASASRAGAPANRNSNAPGGTRTGGPARSANPAARLFAAPEIDEVRTLDEKAPLVRLSPLQSAIGSLLVTGTRAVVWEATDLTTGARTADRTDITGTEVQTSGNRQLLDYVEKVAVVPLRHIGELRRALFIPHPGTTMLVEIYDGGSVAVPFETTDPASPGGSAGSAQPLMQVLSLLRVGNQVELRAEPLPTGLEPREIWAEFGFSMTESVSASLRRN